MQELHTDSSYGERIRIEKSGRIVVVAAAVWSGVDDGNLFMDIFKQDSEDSYNKVASQSINFTEIPYYDAVYSEMRPLYIVLDEPLAVEKGDVVDLFFHSDSLSYGSAVFAVQTSDTYSDGEYISYSDVQNSYDASMVEVNEFRDLAVTLLLDHAVD